jgi:hypothetical protein
MVRLNHDDMKQTKITMETIKDGNTKRKKNDKGNCCEPKTNISRMNMVVTHKVSDHHLYHESQGLAAVSPRLCS